MIRSALVGREILGVGPVVSALYGEKGTERNTVALGNRCCLSQTPGALMTQKSSQEDKLSKSIASESF